MNIKAGFALIEGDDGFKVEEKVCINIEEGLVASIGSWSSCPGGAVGGDWLMILPQPANAHIHSGDFAFPEFGVELGLEEAVAPPAGVKHRLLSRLSFRGLVEAIRRVYLHAWERGVGLLVDFREGGGLGCRAAREALAGVRGLRVLVLGRPGPGWPEGCDGLGVSSPLDYDPGELKRLVGASRYAAAHIAETPRARMLGDLELAVEAGFTVAVHGTHLAPVDFEVLRDRGIGLVVCPRSNMWHGLGLPRVDEAYKAGVSIGLGSDNAAWFTPDPWEEARILTYIGRLLGLKRGAAEIAASALFKSGYEIFGEQPSVPREGSPARIVLALVPDGVPTAVDKLYAVMKRMEAKHILARVDGGEVTLLANGYLKLYQALRESIHPRQSR